MPAVSGEHLKSIFEGLEIAQRWRARTTFAEDQGLFQALTPGSPRDPTSSSEFCMHDTHMHTPHWLYLYFFNL